MTTDTKDYAKVLADAGLTVESQHLPQPNLKRIESGTQFNYRVRLIHNGRLVWEGEYHMGIGFSQFAKSYKRTIHEQEMLLAQLAGERSEAPKINPADVVHSLLSDSDALDYKSFEDWAPSLGYDPDSRKAEAVYQACLKIGLALRNSLGDAKMAELREVFSGY